MQPMDQDFIRSAKAFHRHSIIKRHMISIDVMDVNER